MKGHGIMTGAGGGGLSIFCQETEPSKDGLWIKDGSISKVVVADLVHGTEESYSTGDMIPTPASAYPSEHSMGSYGNEVHIFGNSTSTHVVYNTVTKEVSTINGSLGTIRNRFVIYYNGKLYGMGGGYHRSSDDYSNTSNAVNKLDLATAINTTCTTLAQPCCNVQGGIVGSVVYLFSPVTSSSSRYSYSSNYQKYDLETEVATEIGNFDTSTSNYGNSSVGQIGSVFYVFGGADYDSSGTSRTSRLKIYDSETNVVTSGAAMPANREGAAALSWGSSIYLIGGYTGSAQTSIYRYDADTNTYTTLTATSANVVARYTGESAPSAQVGDKLYILGDCQHTLADTNIYCFTAAGDNYDLNTAVVHLSEAGAYQPTLMETNKMTLKPRVKRVMKQTAEGLVTVAAAVVENGVATDII